MRLARVSKRERAENLAAALEACALTERADDRVMTLSTGLKQRANITRALAARPELLLLDEPTSGLDPAAAQKVYDTLIDLQTTGITFIICTHLMQEADDLCDRVLFLNTGRILVDGPPDEVRKSAGDIVYTIPATTTPTWNGSCPDQVIVYTIPATTTPTSRPRGAFSALPVSTDSRRDASTGGQHSTCTA